MLVCCMNQNALIIVCVLLTLAAGYVLFGLVGRDPEVPLQNDMARIVGGSLLGVAALTSFVFLLKGAGDEVKKVEDGFEAPDQVLARWNVEGELWKAYVDESNRERLGCLPTAGIMAAAFFGFVSYNIASSFVYRVQPMILFGLGGAILGGFLVPTVMYLRIERRRRKMLALGGGEVQVTRDGVQLADCSSFWNLTDRRLVSLRVDEYFYYGKFPALVVHFQIKSHKGGYNDAVHSYPVAAGEEEALGKAIEQILEKGE